ncbi:DUF1376 domain-containing protein [Hymenobacter glacialis]|uniref:DUF1376 domain-containing protein n=1 Tax=Hymenobacter glacialis TaxID=1908236 RepID=A0A1G1SWQ4_9BACT|nr:DUF1376 domain-containing protein [Hymenobacter glacialis]OGX83053.1 hypothetical protein BEN48_04690 [Hymenobacter glacialis]
MKAPAFLFYTGDFLSSPDVQLMEAHEVGAYCLLLFNSWQSDRPGYLTADENRLRRTARLSADQWAGSRELLLGKFPLATDEPTLRYNPRLVQEAHKQAIKRERLAANGRKGGRPEKHLLSKNNQLLSQNLPAEPENPPEEQMLADNEQKLSSEKQLPPKEKANEKAFNFSFNTSNEVEREAAEAAPPAPAKPERKKATVPTLAEVQAYAAEQHPASADAQTEAAAFHDHYQSNGWRVSGKTPMADWRASFRGWMRRRPQFQAAGPHGSGQAAPPARARTAPKSTDPTRWS